MVTIPTIDQISGTTVMNKMRSLIHNYIEFGTEVGNSVNYMQEVIDNLPHDITDVYNKATIDAMFGAINDEFDNYYTKSAIDTIIANYYTKTEVNNLISTIGSFHAVVVDSLPTYGEDGIIYLVQQSESGENIYKEYIWVNRWELIGQLSNIDLNNYYTKTEANDTFPVKSAVYTKLESDALYPLKTNVYTKTETDTKFFENKITTIKSGTGYTVYQYGKIVIVRLEYVTNMTIADLPSSLGYYKCMLNGVTSANVGQATIYGTTVSVTNTSGIAENMLGTLIYFTA